jgi:large subunit ribosomal protein L22
MSPKKLNLIAALIRGLSTEEARAQLSLLPKRGARVAEKVLSSATANAVHNAGLTEGRLRVALATVTKGSYLKRIKYHARGKTVRRRCHWRLSHVPRLTSADGAQGVMHHPKCHLTVVVEEVPAATAEKLSRRTARRVMPETPAWLRHRMKREQRAARIARDLGRPVPVSRVTEPLQAMTSSAHAAGVVASASG